MNMILAYLPANIWLLFLVGVAFILTLILVFRLQKTEWVIYFLLIWFPLESLVLRYTPIKYYSYIKYIPELVLYGLFFGVIIYWIMHRTNLKNVLNKWLILIIGVSFISLLFNWYSPFTWALGMRQLFRFILVFFIVLIMQYDKTVLKKFIYIGAGMIGLEIFFAFLQYLSGGKLDSYLFSSQIVSVGNMALLGGNEQFWTAGSRVFATMGRYDILGSFLALGTLILFPWVYFLKTQKEKFFYWGAMILSLVVLFLTSSRASWLAVIFGILFLGIFILKDKRILWAVVGLGAVTILYLGLFALTHDNVFSITEKPNQVLAERIFEAVNFNAWRSSYEGFGRIFFIINVPISVVYTAPVFGMGPGNFGGGVAAALNNTLAYDKLHLPFGIQDYYGQIDNSWWAILGEVGFLGLFLWVALYVWIIKESKKNLLVESIDNNSMALNYGLISLTIGLFVLGFFGPYLEFRTLMFYYWLFVGIVFSWKNLIK